METNNKQIIFDFPDNISIIDIINNILKNNGLQESYETWLEKDTGNEESKTYIIKDAALVIFEKKIPEEKLVQLLQKHLETTKTIAEKVITDIKEKIIPYVKEEFIQLPQEKYLSPTQKLIIEKIKYNPQIKKDLPLEETIKDIKIKSVEENAEILKKERENKIKIDKVAQSSQNKIQTDKYKENIE